MHTVVTIDSGSLASAGELFEQLDAARANGARCAMLIVANGAPFVSDRELGALALFPVPIVCACSGTLQGSALALVLAADIRVCDSTTVFDSRGLSGEALRRLELLAPNGMDAVLTADEALRVGLVSSVEGRGGAPVEARRIAEVIASRGPIATQLGKEAVWRGLALPFKHALRFETDLTLLLQTTKDRAEGIAAFAEKREPRFTGD